MDFWEICRSVSGGGCRAATARRPSAGGVSRRRPPGGAWAGIAAFQAARITSAFRRAPRVPFRTDEKEPKVRLRTLRRVLRNLREYLASTRRLPPLPPGTPAAGSIQVADAPNGWERKLSACQWAVSYNGKKRGGTLLRPASFPSSSTRPLTPGRCVLRVPAEQPFQADSPDFVFR